MATDTLGESTKDALSAARKWVSEAPVQAEAKKFKIVETSSDEDEKVDD